MRALAATAILDVWEQSEGRRPWATALLALAAADLELGSDLDAAADLPIGERDRRLLRLRAATCGPRLGARATCPACGEEVELDLDTDDLLAAPTDPAALRLDSGGVAVELRLPTSRDLAHAAAAPDPAAALARACVVAPEGLDLAAWAPAIEAALAAADPHAEIAVDLACPACHAEWSEVLDVCDYFTRELDVLAARLLDEVDRLARAYGWTEAEVLALGPRRRRHYLERAFV